MRAPQRYVPTPGSLERHLAEVLREVGAELLLAARDRFFEIGERAIHLVEAAAEERTPADEIDSQRMIVTEQIDRCGELFDRRPELAGRRECVDELDEEKRIVRI